MLAMTGDLIRKNTGFPGQKHHKQETHPENQPNSRTEKHFREGLSGKRGQIPDIKKTQKRRPSEGSPLCV